MTELEAESGRSHVREIDRIAAFTDGVMAIAITLLVLNLNVPQLGRGQEGLLDDKLYHLWRDFLAYGISFAVIGRYWLIHLYRDIATAVIGYAIVLTATSGVNSLIVSHALRRGFVDPTKRTEIEAFGGTRALLVTAIFAVRPRLPALPYGARDYASRSSAASGRRNGATT
jgi:Endosomal/lysosomal potassium channel TMEM175